jgi:hypothetical protein
MKLTVTAVRFRGAFLMANLLCLQIRLGDSGRSLSYSR